MWSWAQLSSEALSWAISEWTKGTTDLQPETWLQLKQSHKHLWAHVDCRVKHFPGGCQQNRHLRHRERERKRETGQKERESRAIFRSFNLERGSPNWNQRGRSNYSPTMLSRNGCPMHRECMAKGCRGQQREARAGSLAKPGCCGDSPQACCMTQPLQSSHNIHLRL